MFIPYLIGAPLWTPTEITTGIWLDGNDLDTLTVSSGSISKWDDKSGNDNNVEQSEGSLQPSLNGTTIECVSGQLLAKSNQVNCLASNGSHVLFMVHDVIDPSTSTSGFPNIFENFSDGVDERRPLLFYRQADDELSHSVSSMAGSSVSSEVPSVSTYAGKRICAFAQQGSANIVYIDSEIRASATVTAGTTTTSNRLRLGDLSNQNLAIKFNEIILIAGTVSAETRQLVEGYLAHKWGLEGNLPANHPYKTKAPTK